MFKTEAEWIREEIAGMIEVEYATDNGAYRAGKNINPTGGLNHSIGYAQPSADVIVRNMNKTTASWGVTAILGDFHKGQGRIILCLPMKKGSACRNWGCGSGSKGSYNNSHVQWEVCEPSGHTYSGGAMIGYDVKKNAEYFDRMWKLLVKWNVYVALELGYDSAAIVDHAEAYRAGMGSNHSDMGHWLQKHGKSMNNLRAEVKDILDAHKRKIEVAKMTLTENELNAFVQKVINSQDDKNNPIYKDLKDVPSYWKEETRELLVNGIIDGGTPYNVNPTDLNIRHETLKSAIIALRIQKIDKIATIYSAVS